MTSVSAYEALPSVTIAIPTYNRARTYLPACLEGALRQTYPNLEIIVADNGSTDDTGAVVRRYCDARLRYIRHETNIPPNDNFNFCLRAARGDYFLLLLDDEQIDPDFVDSCMQAVNFRRDVGLIHTGLRVINGYGHVIHEAAHRGSGATVAEFCIAWFEGRMMLYLCNTLFHRACLLQVGGFVSRHNLFQDVIAQVKVAARMPRAHVPAIKATTRLHGGQYTYAARVRAWCEDSLELLQVMCASAPAENEILQKRGMRFFATIGYSRANAIRSPLQRLAAYAHVYQFFGHRYAPPLRLAFSATSAYRWLRQLKRRLRHQPAWVD